MNKIIIHNKTEKNDSEVLGILRIIMLANEDTEYSAYYEFNDGVKVQYAKRKTCDTFVVFE